MADKNTSKKLADKLFPIKTDIDETDILNIPPESRRLHTETYDFTVASINDYLVNGNIFIPEFQREYVWNRAQASRLIESLVIQCPIPVIYLNQERDEKLSVIDGNQRLQSIRLFLNDSYELRGLTTYPELEGLSYSLLDPRIRRHILNRTLRCIAILKDTHPQIKFEIFERLNTGAVQLNPQEIRHGVYHGPLIDLIDNLSKEPIWKEITGFRSDKRMRGNELILRFIALYENLDKYQKPLSSFLNNFCEAQQRPSNDKILGWKSIFLQTVRDIKQCLGEYSFRTFDEQGNLIRNINSALFDAQMIGFSKIKMGGNKIKREDIIRDIKLLYAEDKFKESITAGTSTTSFVKYRIDRFTKFLERY